MTCRALHCSLCTVTILTMEQHIQHECVVVQQVSVTDMGCLYMKQAAWMDASKSFVAAIAQVCQVVHDAGVESASGTHTSHTDEAEVEEHTITMSTHSTPTRIHEQHEHEPRNITFPTCSPAATPDRARTTATATEPATGADAVYLNGTLLFVCPCCNFDCCQS